MPGVPAPPGQLTSLDLVAETKDKSASGLVGPLKERHEHHRGPGLSDCDGLDRRRPSYRPPPLRYNLHSLRDLKPAPKPDVAQPAGAIVYTLIVDRNSPGSAVSLPANWSDLFLATEDGPGPLEAGPFGHRGDNELGAVVKTYIGRCSPFLHLVQPSQQSSASMRRSTTMAGHSLVNSSTTLSNFNVLASSVWSNWKSSAHNIRAAGQKPPMATPVPLRGRFRRGTGLLGPRPATAAGRVCGWPASLPSGNRQPLGASPGRGCFLEKARNHARNGTSSSLGGVICRRWVDRAWPTTRHALRSETRSQSAGVPQPCASAPGLVVSPGHLPQHVDVQGLVGQDPLQALVLPLELSSDPQPAPLPQRRPVFRGPVLALQVPPQLPRFGCPEYPGAFCRHFFTWYDGEHPTRGSASTPWTSTVAEPTGPGKARPSARRCLCR